MKYCSHCGNQLADEAVICPQCGCAANAGFQPNPNGAQTSQLSPLAIVGFVFAFIGPLVGLICSIIANKNAVQENDERSRSFSKAGIIISAVLLGIEVLSILIVAFVFIIGMTAVVYY